MFGKEENDKPTRIDAFLTKAYGHGVIPIRYIYI